MKNIFIQEQLDNLDNSTIQHLEEFFNDDSDEFIDDDIEDEMDELMDEDWVNGPK